jgi:hypothetical protein
MSHPFDTSLIHPNLKQLSHSGEVLLHLCPRKFELEKLMERREERDVHLDFGKLVGYGIQEYFLTGGDLNKVYWKMFSYWKGQLDDLDGEKQKKTFWFGLYSIDKFVQSARSVFADYKLAVFNSIPACELGFRIDCGDGFTYRGFLDLVLVKISTGALVVLENKTTGSYEINDAMYKHSGQGLGYSLILDVIAGALGTKLPPSYKVFYNVYKSRSMEWEVLDFNKSHTSRALWIKNLLLDKQYIIERATDEYFPMRGESCNAFNRPCKFFEMCEMSNRVLLIEGIQLREEADNKYQFQFKLNEIVDQMLAKQLQQETEKVNG